MLNKYVTFIAFLLVCPNLFASEYFVSNASEITSVLSIVQPGDTLTMRNGTWKDQRVVFRANGVEGDSVLLRAETPGRVVLTGISNLRIDGQYLKVDGLYFLGGYSTGGAVVEFRDGSSNPAHHCRLTNTVIEDWNPGSINTDYKWVSLYGTYNRVDHCYIAGKNHSGTTLVVWLDGNPNYHLIDHNHFGFRPELGFNGGETIRVGTSDYSLTDSYTIVEYNYFEHCNGETEIISNKSCENIYRYNTFYESEGALTLRHGNRCRVEGNFFIGNLKSKTGGVRVIGENHVVVNNYFQELQGTGYRSALTLMNGVPDSPLNRYFQVKNAAILFNTFVNCTSTIVIGAGADDELTLPPKDCLIANNLAETNLEIIDLVDDPDSLTWAGNIFYGGPLGIEQPQGIIMVDPLLALAADGLWRPESESPALAAAEGFFPTIIDDMDGQSRPVLKDIGADQYSADPILRRPLTPEDVGPNWTPPTLEPPKTIRIAAGQDSLLNAIENANDGDTIELISSGGIYANSANLVINKNLKIQAAINLSERPVIQQNNPDTDRRAVFEIQQGSRLSIKGLDLDGMAGSDIPAICLIQTDDQIMSSRYDFFADSCYFHDVVSGSEGNFFCAYAGSLADTIRFNDCYFSNSGEVGIRLRDEVRNSGKFNVDYFELTNCSFWNIKKEAVHIYAGDDVWITPGPVIRINHCTFDNCGYDQAGIIHAEQADFTEVKNSLFTNSNSIEPSLILYGAAASLAYSDTFYVGPVSLLRGARMGEGMLGADPLYLDPSGGNFSLSVNSPVLDRADDQQAMGHLIWSVAVSIEDAYTLASRLPENFRIYQNYPNPFNPLTSINYDLPAPGPVKINIYNARGQLVNILLDQIQEAGRHSVKWQPQNLASGIYIAAIQAYGAAKFVKMIYLK